MCLYAIFKSFKFFKILGFDNVVFGSCAPGLGSIANINNAILGVGKVTLKLVFVPGVVVVG